MALLKHQIKFLRGKCHALHPIVMVGQKGLTPEVLSELDTALNHHELVKIKLAVDDKQLRQQLVNNLCDQSQAEAVQTIGKTVSLYRANLKNPVIKLPTK